MCVFMLKHEFVLAATTFDPFGGSPKQPAPDLLGSFLGSSNATSDPFLQAARSPSPTPQGDPFHMGRKELKCLLFLKHKRKFEVNPQLIKLMYFKTLVSCFPFF